MTLQEHIYFVKKRTRRFENVAQSISQMVLECGYEKIYERGSRAYDYLFFRQGKIHPVGMIDTISRFVDFAREAARGGSAKERAFLMVGEPGNGKTFLVKYICDHYKAWLAKEPNRRYTFRFSGLDKLGGYGKIKVVESQIFEDPMILAMNLYRDKDEAKEFLAKNFGFDDSRIDEFFLNYRPLGACSEYILDDIRRYTDGDVERMLEFVEVVPVPLGDNTGVVTATYSPHDKYTSTTVDLIGGASLRRELQLESDSNPYRYALREGILARVGGGGIFFADEMLRHRPDFLQIYITAIQERRIEIHGFVWSIDVFIVGTSNNDTFFDFAQDEAQAPIKQRCDIVYMSHCTNYIAERELVGYALNGIEKLRTLDGKPVHVDPNFADALGVATVLTALPRSDRLTPIEMLKLAANQVAGDKSPDILAEIVEEMSHNKDVAMQFAQVGAGWRNMAKTVTTCSGHVKTNEGACMGTNLLFDVFRQVILRQVGDEEKRAKYFEDLRIAKQFYRQQVRQAVFNAYRDDPKALGKDVGRYVNMVVAIQASDGGKNQDMWTFKDSSGKIHGVKIDRKFVESVEDRLGLKTEEARKTYRTKLASLYANKAVRGEAYGFMDNEELVDAVADVVLNSDIAGAGSLVGALTNTTNEENKMLRTRMISTMIGKLGYCETCAIETIKFFCTRDDESK